MSEYAGATLRNRALHLLLDAILDEGQTHDPQFRQRVVARVLAQIETAKIRAAKYSDDPDELANLEQMETYVHGFASAQFRIPREP